MTGIMRGTFLTYGTTNNHNSLDFMIFKIFRPDMYPSLNDIIAKKLALTVQSYK